MEVFHDGQWGTVCDDFWDWVDARVVCRQLGLPTGSPMAHDEAHFGQGLGPILLDDVECEGDEPRLDACLSDGWGNENCGHHEDAGVSCRECVPGNEVCDARDNDCDGEVDESAPGVRLTRDCYTGRPPPTEDQGECHGGEERCEDDGDWSGVCEGEVVPTEEVCGNEQDDDCDGEMDQWPTCCHPGVVVPHGRIEEQWVRVCPGESVMGSAGDEPWRDDDEEQHRVAITRAFEIQAAEVTVAQWRECHERGGCPLPDYYDAGCNELDEAGKDAHPINCVGWYDAVAYCNWLSRTADPGLEECYLDPDDGTSYDAADAVAGKTPARAGDAAGPDCPGFRLPTEAEWEYAARAGTAGMFYNCGPQGEADACDADNLATCEAPNADLEEVAVYCANDPDGTAEVGSKQHPNAWGLHDPLGNVREWVWDGYAEDYGGHQGMGGAVEDPTGGLVDDVRVYRGGSFGDRARSCRAATRGSKWAGTAFYDRGLRPCRTRLP